jgi:hypothetical protein
VECHADSGPFLAQAEIAVAIKVQLIHGDINIPLRPRIKDTNVHTSTNATRDVCSTHPRRGYVIPNIETAFVLCMKENLSTVRSPLFRIRMFAAALVPSSICKSQRKIEVDPKQQSILSSWSNSR